MILRHFLALDPHYSDHALSGITSIDEPRHAFVDEMVSIDVVLEIILRGVMQCQMTHCLVTIVKDME